MRRRRRSACHTADRRGEAGSIALEASLIMPVVMMAIVLFICLIRLSTVQMAVHGAASQVARQAASGMYPAALAAGKAGQYLPSAAGTGALSPGVGQAADLLERALPAPAGSLLAAIVKGDWQGAGEAAGEAVGAAAFEPLLQQSIDDRFIDPDRLAIRRIALPDLTGGEDAYFAVEVDYTFPLGLPFTRKSITLSERAEERSWLADSVPAERGGAEGEASTKLSIVSLEPDPLRPGRQAYLTAYGEPGSTVTLTVQYKSGSSKAKHLGEAVVGADGIVKWSWLVSGNTTPGIWELVVTASDGTRAARHFVVQKSSGNKEE